MNHVLIEPLIIQVVVLTPRFAVVTKFVIIEIIYVKYKL